MLLTIFALGLYDLQAGLGTFAVGTLIVGIGLSLGGTTGYALNPARDLGPRIMHSILPIPNKGDGDWSYAWIPVVGPIVGGPQQFSYFHFSKIKELLQQSLRWKSQAFFDGQKH